MAAPDQPTRAARPRSRPKAVAVLRETPASGALIGGYEIVAPLSRGGMGSVFRARQVGLEREVALKIPTRAVLGDEELLARFEREARTLASIDHPHVVRAIDFGDDDGLPYLVTELIEGRDLFGEIEAGGPLPEARVARLGAEIARALARLHRDGITHRDVKPENILIDRTDHARLCDLGTVTTRAGGDAGRMTSVGSVLGTLAYAAPEQLRSATDADARSDIYGLGVTLLHALAGRAPFSGTEAEVVSAVLRDGVPAAVSLAPGVSAAMASLLARMTARDPDERLGDAEAIAGELDRIGTGRGNDDRATRVAPGSAVGASPVGATAAARPEPRPAPAARRTTPVWAWAAIVLAIPVGAGLIGATIGLRRASRRGPDPTPGGRATGPGTAAAGGDDATGGAGGGNDRPRPPGTIELPGLREIDGRVVERGGDGTVRVRYDFATMASSDDWLGSKRLDGALSIGSGGRVYHVVAYERVDEVTVRAPLGATPAIIVIGDTSAWAFAVAPADASTGGRSRAILHRVGRQESDLQRLVDADPAQPANLSLHVAKSGRLVARLDETELFATDVAELAGGVRRVALASIAGDAARVDALEVAGKIDEAWRLSELPEVTLLRGFWPLAEHAEGPGSGLAKDAHPRTAWRIEGEELHALEGGEIRFGDGPARRDAYRLVMTVRATRGLGFAIAIPVGDRLVPWTLIDDPTGKATRHEVLGRALPLPRIEPGEVVELQVEVFPSGTCVGAVAGVDAFVLTPAEVRAAPVSSAGTIQLVAGSQIIGVKYDSFR